MTGGLSLAIAMRHLAGRRRQTVTSLTGVALGVAFFIAIAAMMQGFQRDFVNRIINASPHVTTLDQYRTAPRQAAELAFPGGAIALRGLKPRDEVRGIRSARAIIAALDGHNGIALAPALSGQGLLRYGSHDTSADIIGITPEREAKVTTLANDLLIGKLEDLFTAANGIILGEGLAQRSGITVGAMVSVISPAGIVLRMKVVGIFRSGITLKDNNESYVLLKKAQILQDRPNVINRIRLRLDDVAQAEETARRIETRFGYRTESWQEQSANVLSLFVVQNAVMYTTVGAILIVACFGIFNVISTVVFEKTRDIGILKSIGLNAGDVTRVFLWEGLVVGVVGTIIGWGVGYAMIEFMASLKFQMVGLVRSEGFILYRSVSHYLISGGMALAASLLAAWLPARRAGRLNPVDIVRGAT